MNQSLYNFDIPSDLRKEELVLSFLKTNIYPKLNQSMYKLIDFLQANDEINKYKEKLKKQKILDKIEQKRIEKERLKQELGSEYESSENSDHELEQMGLNKKEIKKMKQLHKQMTLMSPVNSLLRQQTNQQEQLDVNTPNSQSDFQISNFNLKKIDEIQQDHDEVENSQQKTERFDPLQFMANQLRLLNK